MTHWRTIETHRQLLLRICGGYLEMPGLQLTRRQAQRLFGLDEHMCATLLDELVAREFLARQPGGTYIRRTEGRATPGSLHESHREPVRVIAVGERFVPIEVIQ